MHMENKNKHYLTKVKIQSAGGRNKETLIADIDGKKAKKTLLKKEPSSQQI